MIYTQRCHLCWSDGRLLIDARCNWCQGYGVTGNGEAQLSRGQLTHRLAGLVGGAVSTTITVRRRGDKLREVA